MLDLQRPRERPEVIAVIDRVPYNTSRDLTGAELRWRLVQHPDGDFTIELEVRHVDSLGEESRSWRVQRTVHAWRDECGDCCEPDELALAALLALLVERNRSFDPILDLDDEENDEKERRLDEKYK